MEDDYCSECDMQDCECGEFCIDCGEALNYCECEEPLSPCDLKDREVDMRYEEQEEK
jgi:hypothetical protein